MSVLKPFVLILVLLALVVVALSAYTVDEGEVALKFQLGELVEENIAPGLHWKIPFMQTVSRFDARIQTLDEPAAEFLTKEKSNVLVDAFVKWRVVDAGRFYRTVAGRIDLAQARLRETVRSSLRTQFSQRTLGQVLDKERPAIVASLAEAAKVAAQELGLELVDVRLQRVDLPSRVVKQVFQQMVTERESVARGIRASGEEQAARIRAEAKREYTVTLATARLEAARTRAEAKAKAADIYASTYGKDPEFFAFYRSLEAYVASFQGDDVLILKPEESRFFRYFDELPSGR